MTMWRMQTLHLISLLECSTCYALAFATLLQSQNTVFSYML